MPTEPLALATIAGLLLVKEAGVPVPVPGDLLVLGAGAAAGHGSLDAPTALVALVLASVVGGTLQFVLLTTAARRLVLRGLERLGLPLERLDRQAERLRSSGARGVGLARMTPGLRIATIPAAAVAGVPAGAFVAGLALGNAVFIAAHFGLGFLLGEPIVELAGSLLGPVAFLGVVLALLGALGWAAIGRRTRGAKARELVPAIAWADAACPACLAAAVLARTETSGA